MDDKFKIIIQSQLDESEAQINSLKNQIKTIAGQLDPVNLKINIDSPQFQQFTEDIKNISNTINQQFNKGINPSGLDKLSITLDTTNKQLAFMSKRIRESTNAQGDLVRETSRFKQEVNEAGEAQLILTKRTEETVSNYKKQREEAQRLSDQLNLFKQRMLGADGLKGELEIFATKNPKFKDNDALMQIEQSIRALNIDTPNLTHNMKQLSTQFGLLKQEATQSASLVSRTFDNIFKFARFYLVGGSIVKLVNALKGSIETVRELDSSLVELNRVASLTASELENVSDKAFKMGRALGRTGKEVIDATAEWKRAGYDIAESMELAEQSLLLTNIGDGIDDVKEASSSLIAILKGFKKEAKDAGHIVDSLNEISNNFAVDTNNITEILKRTSGTIAQTGTSFEELISIATAGFESLRNAEVVASGINMISQRLRGMNEEGENVSDLIPKIQTAFDKYTRGAVSVIDKQNGGLHSTYEILEQLSRVYPTLTDEAKAFINESVAGNRQNKVLVAIMENWRNVQSAIEVANNSLGSAAKENAIYLDSIEGRSKQLQSSIQMLWKNTIDSDVIKFFIDVGTTMVTIIDQVGILNIALLTLVGYMSIIKGFSFVDIVSGLKNIVSVLSTIIGQVYALGGAAAVLSTALSALAPVAIVAGIMGLIGALRKTYVSVEEQRQKVEELTAQYQSLRDEIEKFMSIESPTQEQEKYLELLERELQLQEAILKKEQERLMKKEVFGEGVWGKGMSKDIDDNIRLIGQLGDSINNLQKTIESEQEAGYDTSLFWKQLNDEQERALELEVELIGQKKTLEGYIEVLGNDAPQALRNYLAKINQALPVLQKMNDMFNIEPNIDTDKALWSLDKVMAAYEATQKVAEEATNPERLQKNIDEAVKGYNDVTSKIRSLIKIQQELSKSNEISADTIDEVISKHPELIQYLGDRAEFEKMVTKAIAEQENVQRSAYENILMNSTTFFNEMKRGNADLWNTIADYYGADAQNFYTMSDLKARYNADVIRVIGSGWAQYYASERQAIQAQIRSLETALNYINRNPHGSAMGAELRRRISEAKQLLALTPSINAFNTQVQNTIKKMNFSKVNLGGIKSGSKSTKSSADQASDAIKEFLETLEDKTALIEFNIAMNNLDQSYYEAIGNINEVNKLRVNEINLYKQLNKQVDSNIKAVEAKMKTVKAGSDDYNALQDTLFDLRQEYRQNEITINSINDALKEHDRILRDRIIEAEQLVLKAVLANAKAQYDANKKRLQDEYDTNKKIIQDKIDTLNKEKALLREEYNARRQQKEEEKKLEELRKLEERFNKISKDNSGMYEKEKLDLAKQIADLREEIYEDEVLKQIELREKDIDDQIAKYQQEQELRDAQYKELQEAMDEAYQKAQESYAEYWAEIERIMSGSQDSIISYLKNNLDEYKQAGKLQREAYLEGWGDLFGDVKDIQSGKIKTSTTVKKDVGTSTGKNYSTTVPSGSGGSGGSGSTSTGRPNVSGISAVLKQGSKGNDVKTLQEALNMILGTKLAIDGSFGALTLAAVKQFQKKYGLAVDGSVGPKTKAKFKALGYKEGGWVDYTGLAMVHGTDQNPEAYLKAKEARSVKTLAENLARIPDGVLSKLFRGGIINTRNNAVFQPIINVYADGLSKNDGARIGRDINKEMDKWFVSNVGKLGITVPVTGN